MEEGFLQKHGFLFGLVLVVLTGLSMYKARNVMILERFEENMRFRFPAVHKYDEREYFPAVELGRPDGNFLSLKVFKGKFLVLNLWSTRCAPCLKELSRLQNLKRHYEHGKWNVIAVSLDPIEDAEKMLAFVERYHLESLAGYYDLKKDIPGVLPLESLPVTYIINRQGRILYRVSGAAAWDQPDVSAFLDAIARVR